MNSPLRFVSLGRGHVVCVNDIWAVVRRDTAQNKRILAEAKRTSNYLDWTGHNEIRSLVLLDNGKVIGCSFSVATIFSRLKNVTETELMRDPVFLKDVEAEIAEMEKEEQEEFELPKKGK